MLVSSSALFLSSHVPAAPPRVSSYIIFPNSHKHSRKRSGRSEAVETLRGTGGAARMSRMPPPVFYGPVDEPLRSGRGGRRSSDGSGASAQTPEARNEGNILFTGLMCFSVFRSIGETSGILQINPHKLGPRRSMVRFRWSFILSSNERPAGEHNAAFSQFLLFFYC